MTSKSKILFRYIAGGCFAAGVIIFFAVACLNSYFSFTRVSEILALAAISAGLFLSVPMVSAGGSALLLIAQVVSLFRYIPIRFLILYYIPPVVFAILLLITCLNRSSAKTTGIVAAAILFIPAISYFCDYRFLFGLARLLECAGAVFLGLAFSKPKVKTKSAAAVVPKASGVSDTYEKLTHLKEMLDSGLITQEEFDAKKKDILGF